MARHNRISRRRFFGTAGAATAATAASVCGLAGPAYAYLGGAVVNGDDDAAGLEGGRDRDRGRGRLIPPGKMGTITFTQRDVPSRLGVAGSAAAGVPPTMGFLGGPGFPRDPTDLGPLVPLPGGWRELLAYLAPLGFHQIEFAGYNQNAGNPGGAMPNPAPGGVTTPESRAAYLAYGRTLRGFLDEHGLEAIGNHGFIPSPGPDRPAPAGP
jgi:hypothetical protein